MTANALILSGEHLDRLRAIARDVRDLEHDEAYGGTDEELARTLAGWAMQMADILLARPALSNVPGTTIPLNPLDFATP